MRKISVLPGAEIAGRIINTLDGRDQERDMLNKVSRFPDRGSKVSANNGGALPPSLAFSMLDARGDTENPDSLVSRDKG